MKKLILLSISFLVVCGFGCAPIQQTNGEKPLRISNEEKKEIVEQDIHRVEAMSKRFEQIKKSMIDRGYLKVDELEELLKQEKCWTYPGLSSTCVAVMWLDDVTIKRNWTPHEIYETLCTAINKDYLPFKAMFYLALERGDFHEAENIRMIWTDCFNKMVNFLKHYWCMYDKKTGGLMTIREYAFLSKEEAFSDIRIESKCPYRESDPNLLGLVEKIEKQVQKLTSVVGLKDPMLVTLRKELMTAIREKNWDDAQKIQNLITARENKLQPSQPQVVYKQVPAPGGGGQTTVVMEQPSEQTIKVKRSHGVEDFVRAGSLLTGKSLTRKDLGAAKMLDIIFGW